MMNQPNMEAVINGVQEARGNLQWEIKRLQRERDHFAEMITDLKLKADVTESLVQDHLEETDWRNNTDSLRELRRMYLSAKDKAEMIDEGVIHE